MAGTCAFLVSLLCLAAAPRFVEAVNGVKAAQKISFTAGGLTESGQTLTGGDRFGASLASVGDFDGDSENDICVGAEAAGAVYMLFLNFDGTVKASQKISNSADGFGSSIASVGDLDGDSVTDICVGADLDDDGGVAASANRGAVFVLFLNINGAVKALQKISSTAGGGVSLEDRDLFGCSVASLGDLDGDSVTDICVGAYLDDDGGIDRGAVYVLFLNTDGTVKTSQKISSTTGGLGVSLNDDDNFGFSLAYLGDFDGDSVPDACVGADYDDDSGTNSGAVYLLFLRTDGTVKASRKISHTFDGGTRVEYDKFGSSITSVGDIDGDSVTDICVGADGDDDGGIYCGAVFVLLLNTGGTVKASQKISNDAGGLTASGVTLESNGLFGKSVASLGDLDGDSVTDICVGTLNADGDGGQFRGAVYVLFGNGTSTAGTTNAALTAAASTSGPLTSNSISSSSSSSAAASATGTSTTSASTSTISSLSSGGVATSAAATTAAPGKDPSGSSESVNSNTALIIIVPVTVFCVLCCVGAGVAALFFLRARYSEASDAAGGGKAVEMDVAVDYGYLDDLPQGEKTAVVVDAGPYHNVSRGANKKPISEGAYHNVLHAQPPPRSDAGSYHNVAVVASAAAKEQQLLKS